MAQLKFYKSASAPAAAATGAVWFDTTHHTIQVKTATGWDKYAGALNDATWDGFNLTITKHDGSSIVLNFSDFASASGVTAALAGKLAIGTADDAAGTQSYYGLKNDIAAAQDAAIAAARVKNIDTTATHGVNLSISAHTGILDVTVTPGLIAANDASVVTGGAVYTAIANKNVSAEGDTLVSASASGNKVTVAATDALTTAVANANSALQAADKTELQDGIKAAKTVVNAKADGHVIVTVTEDSTDKHAVVTITEDDIASAQALSGVDGRVAAIEAVMGGDDADKAINKVSEIITFLSGIEEGTVAKDTFDAVTAHGTAITNLQNNTVNGKKISENPVIAGSDVLLTGYTEQTAAALNASDSINVALGKLEARVDAAAAGGVQSVGGKAGSITLDSDATGEGNVKFAISEAGEISATVNIGATATQGAKADTAIQSISGDAYITVGKNGTSITLDTEVHLSTNNAEATDAALATSALAKSYANTAESNAKVYADSLLEWALFE